MSRIEGIFYLEAQGDQKRAVEDSLKSLMAALKREEGVEVLGEALEETLEEEGMYSTAAEVELGFADFNTYLRCAIKYGPSAIEITRPNETVIPADEYLLTVGEVVRVAKTLFTKHRARYRFYRSDKEARIGLSEEEIEGLLDQGALRVKIVVEARGGSEEDAVEELVNAVKEDLFINKAKAKAMDEGSGFSGLVGIEAFMYEARILFNIGVALTPVLIEIMEPEKIRLSALDIQDIGVDMASVFFELAHKLEHEKRVR
ncbi:MAG: hypothetical protein GXO65_02470 [Euryarchaeota archaeon]|nr:hypothetical protein [Euryarchaeota archaeon]